MRPAACGIYLLTPRPRARILARMTAAPAAPQPTVAELIARSDFARLHPDRARELLDHTADPLLEDHPDCAAPRRRNAA